MLFVCAGGNPATFNDKAIFAWLRRLARRGVTIGGISGGPYILARAGLLDGHRATLHWEHQPAFSEDFPDIEVTPSLFEIDGNRITCSGGISALDMMVALIERDHGRELAAAVGDWFLHTHIREGIGPAAHGLALPSRRHRRKIAARAPPDGDQHRDAAVTRRIWRGSPAFRSGSSSGCSAASSGAASTPHYSSMRLERARQLLRETTLPILDVAVATGFASSSQFARAYGRAFGETPRHARASA